MNDKINIRIVKLNSTGSEEFMEILWTALNPEGVTGRTKDILYDQMIKPYYEDWGKKDDTGFCAIHNNKIIGAVWCRIKSCVTKQYSHYPELCIGVLPEYQSLNVGSLLVKQLINSTNKKYNGLRLGVNKNAKRVLLFYDKFGFVEYDKYNEAPQLQLTFRNNQ